MVEVYIDRDDVKVIKNLTKTVILDAKDGLISPLSIDKFIFISEIILHIPTEPIRDPIDPIRILSKIKSIYIHYTSNRSFIFDNFGTFLYQICTRNNWLGITRDKNTLVVPISRLFFPVEELLVADKFLMSITSDPHKHIEYKVHVNYASIAQMCTEDAFYLYKRFNDRYKKNRYNITINNIETNIHCIPNMKFINMSLESTFHRSGSHKGMPDAYPGVEFFSAFNITNRALNFCLNLPSKYNFDVKYILISDINVQILLDISLWTWDNHYYLGDYFESSYRLRVKSMFSRILPLILIDITIGYLIDVPSELQNLHFNSFSIPLNSKLKHSEDYLEPGCLNILLLFDYNTMTEKIAQNTTVELGLDQRKNLVVYMDKPLVYKTQLPSSSK